MSQLGPKTGTQRVSGRDDLRERIESRIRKLDRASGTGMWGMVLFLLFSFAAYDNFSVVPDLSENVREILGASPPSELISLALVVYAFSGIIHTLARMSQNIKPYRGLVHAAFFFAFYLFYHLSGSLQDNYWAVFFAGLSVLGLENYYLWSHSSTAARKERELLASMRNGEE